MATLTLSDAQAQVSAWTAASLALANGQTFSMNGRTLSRTDAAEVRKMLEYWTRIEATLEARQQGTARDRSRMNPGLAKFF